MKLTLLAAAALVAIIASGFAGVPDVPAPPSPPKPPVIEKPSPEIQAKAEAAIKSRVIDILCLTPNFSRSTPVNFKLTFTAAAREGIPAAMLPFEIQHARGSGGKGTPTHCLSGYFDSKKDEVQVFHEATKAYLAAANHPVLKARLKLFGE